MAPGDELAFISRNGISIRKVDKITPSGRIVCGPYTLDSDLRVRGEQDSWNRISVELATDAHRESIARSRLLGDVGRFRNWENLTIEQLQAVQKIQLEAKQ